MYIYPGIRVEALFTHARDERHASRLCLADGRNDLTYAQAREAVLGTAAALQARGAAPGTPVMIACTQDVRFMLGMLGCQLAGLVPVPVESGAGTARIADIYAQTKAPLYLGVKKPEIAAEFLSVKELFADPEALRQAGAQVPQGHFSLPAPESMAEILFTTGTTGAPKGIMLSAAADVAIAENVIDGVHMEEDNVELVPMPLSHSHGLRRTYANIYNGSTTCLVDGVIALKKLFGMMETYHVTSLDISPSILNILFRLSKDRIADYADQMRYVQLGSAPLTEDGKQRLKRDLPHTRLYNFYGTTEAGCSCILDFNAHSGKENCIGRPTKNARFLFVDENRREIAATAENPGFIATAGGQNMIGYLNAPELTAEVCENGYIYTNDLGFCDEDGDIFCLGRKDDVINCGGIKIAPDEIEQEAVKFAGVEDAACVPMPDRIQGQVPRLYVSLKVPQQQFDERGFKKYLSAHLDANKVPKSVKYIPEIPRTGNGKVQRKKLISFKG